MFFKAKRPEFKRLYPNIGNRDRRKKMRLAWKNASDEEKEHYIAERNRLKEEAYGSEVSFLNDIIVAVKKLWPQLTRLFHICKGRAGP